MGKNSKCQISWNLFVTRLIEYQCCIRNKIVFNLFLHHFLLTCRVSLLFDIYKTYFGQLVPDPANRNMLKPPKISGICIFLLKEGEININKGIRKTNNDDISIFMAYENHRTTPF